MVRLTKKKNSSKSAAKLTSPAKLRSAPVTETVEPQLPSQPDSTEAQSPATTVLTWLPDEELAKFKALLLEKRVELVGDVNTMTTNALQGGEAGGGNLSSIPIHMADLGSDNFEQEFTLGLLASERQMLKEIDGALRRIENRTYGVCEGTGQPITIKRLQAKPWARYCIEYARELERRGGSGS
ncbi:MAG: RNA polymerase-binding transcription factor DksA [Phycisphaerae bacterium]|nr:RNA polymerase-binding transcription factor DksA [Phycisphaerae bacterium]